jgi:hypothetical protein
MRKKHWPKEQAVSGCSRLIEMCRFGQIGRDKVLFDAMEQGYRGMKNKDTVLYVAGILPME